MLAYVFDDGYACIPRCIAPATRLLSSSWSNPFSIEKLFVIFQGATRLPQTSQSPRFSFNCRAEREHLLLVKCDSNGHAPSISSAFGKCIGAIFMRPGDFHSNELISTWRLFSSFIPHPTAMFFIIQQQTKNEISVAPPKKDRGYS